ncbi:MAG: SRPBCC family protein [Bacillota bacterium]
MNGTVSITEHGYLMRFERRMPHPVEKVWAALTEPERLADWLADATMELVPGGKLQLRFGNTGSVIDGQVVAVQPPTLLEFTWNSEGAENTLVHWELHPDGAGCRLILTHSFPDRAQLPSMLAGWHTHLEGLPQAVNGERVQWPWDRWEELHQQYRHQVCKMRA